MNNIEILKKVYLKAIENGFKNNSYYDFNMVDLAGEWEKAIRVRAHYSLIFDHSFAKAFWGSKKICINCEWWHSSFNDCDCGVGNTDPEWKIRLRQMVIADDPLKYMESYLMTHNE